ncbi:MAG TPA: glycerol-3-phosphate 1-O-acyltransferase PlsY [Burkholderiales bacterium]
MEYLLVLVAYLIGSIPMAIVVARAFGLPDPRTTGSNNPGATNILRYGGKTAAALTLAGDVLKGVVAILLVRYVTDDPQTVALGGAAVFLGHLYPIFFGFQGGKGVATALGVWLVLMPSVGGLLLLTWLAVAAAFRYSSLAALVAALAAPLYVWLLGGTGVYIALAAGMTVFLFWRHRRNIRNLLDGTEGRIGAKAPSAADR